MRYELTQDDWNYIDHLLTHKDEFDAFVYTPWREAVKATEERKGNKMIETYVRDHLGFEVPFDLHKPSIALCRSVATPNFEMHRFAMCADALQNFKPLILEYLDDKFVGVNPLKKALGRMCFYSGLGYEDHRYHCIEVMNMQDNNGRKIRESTTFSGHTLSDFHHHLLEQALPHLKDSIIDMSEWLAHIGPTAAQYYLCVLCLFLQDVIMFDNFLLSKHDLSMTRNIVLPALISIHKEVNVKPLIVSLDPPDLEGDRFWTSYPQSTLDFVNTGTTIGT